MTTVQPVTESLAQSAAPSGAQRTARWKLLTMVVVLSLPVAVAFWAYWMGTPHGRLEFGELIQPARALGAQTATDLQGQARPLSALKGQWLLVGIQSDACAATCLERLHLLRQLRETLGKDKDRVDAVLLVHDGIQAPTADLLARDLLALHVSPQVVRTWLGDADATKTADFIYVVDPMGNAMARFPAQFDSAGARKIRRILERLLRASVAWDAPGR